MLHGWSTNHSIARGCSKCSSWICNNSGVRGRHTGKKSNCDNSAEVICDWEMIWHRGQEVQLQEGVKLSARRSARDRRTSYKGEKFLWVVSDSLSRVLWPSWNWSIGGWAQGHLWAGDSLCKHSWDCCWRQFWHLLVMHVGRLPVEPGISVGFCTYT